MIKGKRIRSVERHLSHVAIGADVVFGVGEVTRFYNRLTKEVFKELENGQSFLPSSLFGPISKFNAVGGYELHKDRTETIYKEVIVEPVFRLTGKTKKIPYEYCPAIFLQAPNVRLKMTVADDEEKVIISPLLCHTIANEVQLLHVINLFLEIFGECQIFTPKLIPIIKAPIRTLNWEILPAGKNSWSKLFDPINTILESSSPIDRSLILERFKLIAQHDPEFVAIGRANFRGYIVFAFPPKRLYLLESAFNGNATYVFKDEWESLSYLTKTEILNDHLQTDRLIHRENWSMYINHLLK